MRETTGAWLSHCVIMVSVQVHIQTDNRKRYSDKLWPSQLYPKHCRTECTVPSFLYDFVHALYAKMRQSHFLGPGWNYWTIYVMYVQSVSPDACLVYIVDNRITELLLSKQRSHSHCMLVSMHQIALVCYNFIQSIWL